MRKMTAVGCLLLLLALTFDPEILIAQERTKPITVTGRVVDSLSGEPVAYPTVTVADLEMKSVNAVAADMNGKFSIDVKTAGSYKLIVSHLSYTPSISDLELTEEERKIDLGKIAIKEGVTIDAVEITVQKPLIKVDPDKMTYSVEADPEAEYSTVAEILRKVPQLSVDGEDNVLLNGQKDYKVLVNGKSSSLMSNNFKEVIKSMPANSIRDIEVITNPSTKYEAEGVGGIINIITNRRTFDGYSGNVNLGAGSFGSYSASGYISAQMGKFSVSSNYFYNRSGSPRSSYNSVIERYGDFTSTEKISGGGSSRYTGHNLSLEASYEIDTFNLVTLSLWGYMGGNTSGRLTESQKYGDSGNLVERYVRNDDSEYSYGSISGNIDYQRTFMKPMKSFTVSYRLEYDPQSSSQDFRLEYDPQSGAIDAEETPMRRRSGNTAAGSEHTLQVDYYDPISPKHNMEAGLKYILRLNTSDTEATIWDRETQGWLPDPGNMSDLDYTQHIIGLYGGYLFKHNKFTAKGGFRAEGAINLGTAKTSNEGNIDFDNRPFNVVPYANISYMIKPSQVLAISYTQRLMRPGIWYLNPYVDRNTPGYISYGNPNLESAVSNSFSANYSLFSTSWSLFTGGSAAFGNNSIMSYTKSSGSSGGDLLETSYYNMGKEQRYNMNVSFSYRHRAILNIYISLYGSYSIIEGDLSKLPDATGVRELRNEGFNYGGNLGGSTSLWKNGRLSLNYGIFSSSITLQGRGSTFQYSSISLSQRLFKEKLTLSLSVSNPFTEYQIHRNETELAGSFRNMSESRYQSRRIHFSASFRFGKIDVSVKKARRGISNNDVISGEGNSGGGNSGGGQQ